MRTSRIFLLALSLCAAAVGADRLIDNAKITGRLDLSSVTEARGVLPLGAIPPLDLARNAAHAIDSRIADQTPVTALPIYTTQDHTAGTYVRNPQCWAAGLDLTALSPWNAHYGAELAGTAVSPRHVILAEHFVTSSGLRAALPKAMRFVTRGNVVVTRNLTAVTRVGATDIAVGLLDSDLPDTIAPVKVLPADWADYLSLTGLPVLATDKEEKALVGQVSGVPAGTVELTTPADATRLGFWEVWTTGDSGSPALLVIGNELVLLTVAETSTTGDDLSAQLAAINSVMTTLGGGYQLTPMDLAQMRTAVSWNQVVEKPSWAEGAGPESVERFVSIAGGDGEGGTSCGAFGAETQLVGWSDVSDPNNAHTAGEITVTKTGVYQIVVRLECPDPAGAYTIEVWLADEFGATTRLKRHQYGTSIECVTVRQLTAGDVVGIIIVQDSAAAVTVVERDLSVLEAA